MALPTNLGVNRVLAALMALLHPVGSSTLTTIQPPHMLMGPICPSGEGI